MRNILLALAVALIGLASGVASAQSSPSDFTAATRYDPQNRVVGMIAPDPDGSGPLHYAAIRNTYDADGRLTRIEKGELSGWQSELVDPASWTGFNVFSKVETTYDNLDRKTVEAAWGWDSTASAWVEESVTQYSYDVVGRLQCTAQRMNPSIWTALPASACTLGTTSATYGDDQITEKVYDDASQLVQVRKGLGTSIEVAYTTYSYTNNGKQQDVVDANGNHAKFVYDGDDELYQWQFPSTTRASGFNGATPATALSTAGAVNTSDYEQYGYNANGDRTSLRKRDGRTFTYTYDFLDRVTIKTVPDGGCSTPYTCSTPAASATRDVYTGYDLWGRQLYARFDSASGSDGVSSIYDAFGRLTSSTISMGGVSRSLSHQYDADGNRTRVTLPDSNYTQYTYDELERMTGASENGATSIIAVTYDARGERTGITRGAVGTSYGYDPVSRPTSLTDDLAGTTSDVTRTLTYSPASQILGQTRTNDTYAFNGYVDVSRGYTTNGLNQYSVAGPATFGYDSDGSLTSDGTNSFAYDAENRLIGMNGTKTLVYDPDGRLYSVTSGSTTTTFLYDGDELVGEYNSAGTMIERYVHGPAEDDPMIQYDGSGLTSRRSLQTDWEGSIVSIADASGNLVGINAYDEYGIPKAANIGRFQYTGQAWIPELGMYYYKARIYSPTLGRFLQTDPVGYKDQVNLYEYVGDDPVDGRDPSGETCSSSGKGSYVCKIDYVRVGNKLIPIDKAKLTSAQQKQVARFNRNYTAAVNRMMQNNKTVTVGRTGGRPGTSFRANSSDIAKGLIDRKFQYVPAVPDQGNLMESGTNIKESWTNVFDSEMTENDHQQQVGVAHEGIHGSPAEQMGNRLGPVLGYERYDQEHQQPYDKAAEDMLRPH